MTTLASILLCDCCAKLIDFIKNIVLSDFFLVQNRFSPNDFIRNRLLPFSTLVFFLTNLNKGSYQDELDYFYKALINAQTVERIVTKGALTKARKKLKYQAFIELNRHANTFFYDNFATESWKGFNLLAVDGSTALLPRKEIIAQHFGQWHPKIGEPCPKARLSQMFDVLNHITIDAIISPKERGERDLAAQHFFNLMPKDLVLLDRGYPAFWLFKVIQTMKANFCARVSYKSWNITKKFKNSGKKDKIVTLNAPYQSIKECREIGIDFKPMKLRLIRVELENGEVEILITSLLDKKLYPHDIFAELYHLRWPVEEDYKVMKKRIEIENWSGQSVLSVYQDFHAKVFSKNLTVMLAHPTKKAIEQKTVTLKHKYQLNLTQALSKMKDTIVLLFNRPKEVVKMIVSKLHDIFINTIEPIRPGRKFPRNHKIRQREFYPCYKPIR